MADKSQLRVQRSGTIINAISKKQEKEMVIAVRRVCEYVMEKFPGLKLRHQSQWLVKDVVFRLRREHPSVDFHYKFDTSAIRPDGGIVSLIGQNGSEYPILIAEKKNQGTNDLRLEEGKVKQAKGNAIERLGKNVIGLRAALLHESIFPFICFGDGCDFAADSTILDRVVTIAMFGDLNKIYLHTLEDRFNRGSFYFREKPWSENEMFEVAKDIAVSSVYYYFSKYGEKHFA